jgi:iron complex transport system permease protein
MRYGGWVLRLILSGIAISALFSAGVGLLKYLADPLTELPEITFWLLGGLFNVTWRELLFLFPPVLIGSIIVLALRWRLNLLTLSDETAFSLGTQLGRERAVMIFGAVIAVAAVTAVGGIIAWVGLIVPHLGRRMFGADAQFTLPAAMLIGAYYVLICDNVARSLLPGEIPLGILTAFFGALIFAGLMTRSPLRRRP